MKIVVCIKQVPDSAAKISVENGQVSWGDAPLILNPWDEFAVEAALQFKEAYEGEVTAVTVGGASATEVLKTALAMGCNEAILVSDPALQEADSQGIARILAATIQKIGDVQVAFFGRQAIDSDTGVTAAQTGRLLSWPVLSLVSVIKSFDNGTVQVERSIEEGRQAAESKLPLVISVGKDIGEPRYPSFMGIRKASRTVIPVWSLADLNLTTPAAAIRYVDVIAPPSREVTTEIITGDSPQEIASKLVEKILGEKVL